MEILYAMMFRAEEWGLREGGTNPCLGIEKNPRKKLARFLDTDELARLGRALDEHEARWPEAVAAIPLLALTGCRRSEVLNLPWRDIGGDALNLADSKTGPRAVPLGEAARRFGNCFRKCAAGAAAQAPLGLNAGCTTAFIARQFERTGSAIKTPFGALVSHPPHPRCL